MDQRGFLLQIPADLLPSVGGLRLLKLDDRALVCHLLFQNPVIVVDASGPFVAHQPVTPVHFIHGPEQGRGGLFRIGNHGDKQVREILVDCELQHLRIDHNKLDILRAGLKEDA